jgi:hypothetical protein
VQKVKRVSQSKPGIVWTYNTVCTNYTCSPPTWALASWFSVTYFNRTKKSGSIGLVNRERDIS